MMTWTRHVSFIVSRHHSLILQICDDCYWDHRFCNSSSGFWKATLKWIQQATIKYHFNQLLLDMLFWHETGIAQSIKWRATDKTAEVCGSILWRTKDFPLLQSVQTPLGSTQIVIQFLNLTFIIIYIIHYHYVCSETVAGRFGDRVPVKARYSAPVQIGSGAYQT